MPAFEISKSLVTFGQYQKCVLAKACAPAHTIDGTCTVYDEHTGQWGKGALPETFEGDNQPVVCVDWAQASAYSKWAGGRLPSEAEFEYAARAGGREQIFPWGNEAPSCDLAVMSVGVNGCQRKSTLPVCSRKAGNTEQGLCDMTGNASEWVEDWYQDSYRAAAKDGSAQENPGAGRVLRGGSWSIDIAFAPVRVRRGEDPATRSAAIGFRPARSAKSTIAP
jgi:formylglycine-generating enzyme required for sulfatase activity